MQYLREWTSDEERAKAARQQRSEALVWMKLMIEHSPAAGRADPLAVIRHAFADGIDDHWNGRMFDLVTFGGGAVHESLRLSCSMLVGPTVHSLLRRPVSGSGSAFTGPLRQTAGTRAVGPDLIVIVGNPTLTLPKQLPKGALNAKFLIGSLGADPSLGLQELATRSGGTAMALEDEADGRFLSALVCKAFLALAASDGGQVAAPAEAAQHFDAGANRSGYGGLYGDYENRAYALGENDGTHGLASLEPRERRRDAGRLGPSGYGGHAHGYGSGHHAGEYNDDLF